MTENWQFWVDRGGTFTDIVALSPKNSLITHKLLSVNPNQYPDATIAGINQVLSRHADLGSKISNVRIGTTVATNALLERKGEPTAFVTTKGFSDSLAIGYQHRDDLFSLTPEKTPPLYCASIEIAERISAHGQVITPLDEVEARAQLQRLFDDGIRSIAIVLMHGYKYAQHESQLGVIAADIGFTQISLSHHVSKLVKFVSRGDTTVVDAYLSPVLASYVNVIGDAFPNTKLEFMQSSGGLILGDHFKGKDAVLSGPAGGVVAMVETSKQAGFEHIIGFDMGGTSTDVSLFAGQYQREWETTVAGVRLRAPMMGIHTVAAGGGSVLGFENNRLSVGPHSAGAYPGPCSYRNNGPLTVTDLNVLSGKIQPDLFGSHFGPLADQSLDAVAVHRKFESLWREVNRENTLALSKAQLVNDYLTIAIEHMANAIKEISVAKGHNLDHFVINCFGGAGAQHACLVADVLGVKEIILHPMSGVLSAYGMGLAAHRVIKQASIELPLTDAIAQLDTLSCHLNQEVRKELQAQGVASDNISLTTKLLLRYQGSDNTISVAPDNYLAMRAAFESCHQNLFGFVHNQTPLILAAIESEALSQQNTDNRRCDSNLLVAHTNAIAPFTRRSVFFNGQAIDTPFYYRQTLPVGQKIQGPAIIIEQETTVVIEPGWQGQVNKDANLLLARVNRIRRATYQTQRSPMLLEIFNNLFMHIAKEMGLALQSSAMSVNIKERLDFSCAIFDREGALVANAPHMPVHLGSMGSCVKSIIAQNNQLQAGDSYLVNSPYHGGTHLPDLTVVIPVFDPDDNQTLLFFVASRGHHADVGGITPGSMPPNSQCIEDEGILFNNFLLVKQGEFQQDALINSLNSTPQPARNILQNVSDLKAQLAANYKGVNELFAVAKQYSLPVLIAYMQHVQDAAEERVVDVIKSLNNGKFTYALDQGTQVCVSVSVDRSLGKAVVDFTGTSEAQPDNFNAPLAVTRAAVLYVFRTLVDKPIALNDGCLRPIDIIVPQGSMLSPCSPAAVVAGNVETSQVITDALYGALGVLAASQGTMNNFTFGDDQAQYYETICGGSGASAHANGADAIQTHMTNSRLTDPEILESRFAVRLNNFSIRNGSGGSGQFAGGNGVIREVEFLKPMQASILSNRRKVAPFGLRGGCDGQLGETWLISAKNRTRLASSAAVQVEAGDKIVIKTPGGGGFGKPNTL